MVALYGRGLTSQVFVDDAADSRPAQVRLGAREINCLLMMAAAKMTLITPADQYNAEAAYEVLRRFPDDVVEEGTRRLLEMGTLVKCKSASGDRVLPFMRLGLSERCMSCFARGFPDGMAAHALAFLGKLRDASTPQGRFFDPMGDNESVCALLDLVVQGKVALEPAWDILSPLVVLSRSEGWLRGPQDESVHPAAALNLAEVVDGPAYEAEVIQVKARIRAACLGGPARFDVAWVVFEAIDSTGSSVPPSTPTSSESSANRSSTCTFFRLPIRPSPLSNFTSHPLLSLGTLGKNALTAAVQSSTPFDASDEDLHHALAALCAPGSDALVERVGYDNIRYVSFKHRDH
ncbi:hypothetical protein HK405_000200 [Cladochytrium tenue]|nr:hypothetical protein HK405_000200 [Cladochytrium tenue]